MYPHKFIMHYKCQCYGKPLCNCPRKSASSTYFLQNIYDIADTLAEVMIICGIHQCKAKAAIDVVIYSFLHYDEIRHRIDAVPRKRLCKEDLIHDLGRKCLMNRMEAQLTYSIIKRAFKAFYHGTREGGIRNRALEAEAIHSSECLWVHAAKRTAQVFASYEGMFFSAQKSYEAQIRCAYKRLLDRLQTRKSPSDTMTVCACKKCFQGHTEDAMSDWKEPEVDDPLKSVELNPLAPAKSVSQYRNQVAENTDKMLTPKTSRTPSNKRCDMSMLTEQQLVPEECSKPACNLGIGPVAQTVTAVEKNASKSSINLPRCYTCNCPKLVCDCDVDLETGVLSTECSQGPFTCRWIRVDDENDEDRPDPCITRPEEHECPIDCEPTTSQLTCNVECECDCEDCECIEEDSSGYDDENEAADNLLFGLEEEAIFEETDTEPTSYDIPDMSTLGPNQRFAGCRVQVNHVVEETSSTNNPASIAQVEVHRIEASIRSEPVESGFKKSSVISQKGSGESGPQKTPLNATKSVTKEEEQNKREETEAISKILADLL